MNHLDPCAVIDANVSGHLQACAGLERVKPLVADAAMMLVAALQSGGRVLFCGNGGSAADAQHLAAELSGRYLIDRPPLDAVALHCNTSALTAIANDYAYDMIFARLVEAHARPGDVLVAISTSGESPNIVKAAQAARKIGGRVIALTGAKQSTLGALADVAIQAPSEETPRIQEMHILIGHTLCEIVEKEIFAS